MDSVPDRRLGLDEHADSGRCPCCNTSIEAAEAGRLTVRPCGSSASVCRAPLTANLLGGDGGRARALPKPVLANGIGGRERIASIGAPCAPGRRGGVAAPGGDGGRFRTPSGRSSGSECCCEVGRFVEGLDFETSREGEARAAKGMCGSSELVGRDPDSAGGARAAAVAAATSGGVRGLGQDAVLKLVGMSSKIVRLPKEGRSLSNAEPLIGELLSDWAPPSLAPAACGCRFRRKGDPCREEDTRRMSAFIAGLATSGEDSTEEDDAAFRQPFSPTTSSHWRKQSSSESRGGGDARECSNPVVWLKATCLEAP